MVERIEKIEIPSNINEWLKRHCGVNISFNLNEVDAINGYGQILRYSVTASVLKKRCHRCGYDSLWNPDDSNSKCLRHTYEEPTYDAVFVWDDFCNDETLEEAFDKWLGMQPKEEWKKAVFYFSKGERK